jgi:putative tryptophan/tyrosine transport system substrate-binding protein
VRRREFISFSASRLSRAQQPKRMRRIGVLMGYPENDLEGPAFFAAFRERLEKLGWVEARNIRFDTRWATPEDAEARRRFAMELVALQPDLILSAHTPTTARCLNKSAPFPSLRDRRPTLLCFPNSPPPMRRLAIRPNAVAPDQPNRLSG